MLCLFVGRDNWSRRISFPVRSNFFYETTTGVLVNYLLSLGAMYPPIFRDRSKASLNKDAVDRLIEYVSRPGSIAGVHPEGTRNKGDDPYQLLKAQPGIGEIALKARPVIVPVFVNGMSNSVLRETVTGQQLASRRTCPIVVVYGDPLDISEFDGQLPRAALYKQVADKILGGIAALIPREKELRRGCLAGDIPDDDPHWLTNIGHARRHTCAEGCAHDMSTDA
jgi:1-acyl-sn-glycerol-3-phosphate acyltransferase